MRVGRSNPGEGCPGKGYVLVSGCPSSPPSRSHTTSELSSPLQREGEGGGEGEGGEARERAILFHYIIGR